MESEKKLTALRRIVERGQYGKVDGVMVDHFSASAILQVYDAIGPEGKNKLMTMPMAKMATVAFKTLERARQIRIGA